MVCGAGHRAFISSLFTPMEARTLAAALLNCGTLDADFLLDLIDTHDLCIYDLLDEAEGFQ
jgi:hypothetical protein